MCVRVRVFWSCVVSVGVNILVFEVGESSKQQEVAQKTLPRDGTRVWSRVPESSQNICHYKSLWLNSRALTLAPPLNLGLLPGSTSCICHWLYLLHLPLDLAPGSTLTRPDPPGGVRWEMGPDAS